MAVTFKKMTPDFIDQVVQIEQQSPSPWNSDQIRTELSKANSQLHVLFDETKERIIGWAAIFVVAGEAELLKVAVDKNYRRCGHASRILKYIMADLKKEKVKKLFLEVRSKNLPACTLYKKHQFKEINRRRGYYNNPDDDALIFMKTILY